MQSCKLNNNRKIFGIPLTHHSSSIYIQKFNYIFIRSKSERKLFEMNRNEWDSWVSSSVDLNFKNVELHFKLSHSGMLIG